MGFYQNVFDSEFQGNLLLSDRQYTMTFKVKSNLPNSSQLFRAWNPGPFDVSTNKQLTIHYSYDFGRTYTSLVVDVSTSATSSSAATALEIITALNLNATFAALFLASTSDDGKQSQNCVQIRTLRPRTNFRLYVANSGAEIALRFNKKAGVSELPDFFGRHTIANMDTYPDGLGMLIALDTGNSVDQNIITEAGFDYSSPKADWQLLRGRSGLFNFKKQTIDAHNRITQIIEYPAGALVGDLAKLTAFTYTGITNTFADETTEIPYVLTSGDLITPP
jgi:hypothetical protein